MRRRILPEDHPEMAMSLSKLATCHRILGEYDKAASMYEELLAMRRRILPEDPPGHCLVSGQSRHLSREAG
jgi:hypothetical protein